MAIRGVLDTPPDMQLDQMWEFWGDGMPFGLGPNRLPHGFGTNWYASARRGEGSPAEALAWACDAYAGFPEPVRATLAAATPAQTVVNTILESRRPRWLVRGRYVLVGDAAHADVAQPRPRGMRGDGRRRRARRGAQQARTARRWSLRPGSAASRAANEGRGRDGAAGRPLAPALARAGRRRLARALMCCVSRSWVLSLTNEVTLYHTPTLATEARYQTITSSRATRLPPFLSNQHPIHDFVTMPVSSSTGCKSVSTSR